MALILITGASAGLGRASVTALIDQGHDVVLHARSAERIGDDSILARTHDVLYGDLSSLSATVQVAQRANEIGVFDAVIHNAGVLRGPEVLAVNTIAPFVLTALMAPRRSVYLSSSMHFSGSTDLGQQNSSTCGVEGVPTRTASSTSPLWRWRSPRDARTCCPTPWTPDGFLPAWEGPALPTASPRATSHRLGLPPLTRPRSSLARGATGTTGRRAVRTAPQETRTFRATSFGRSRGRRDSYCRSKTRDALPIWPFHAAKCQTYTSDLPRDHRT